MTLTEIDINARSPFFDCHIRRRRTTHATYAQAPHKHTVSSLRTALNLVCLPRERLRQTHTVALQFRVSFMFLRFMTYFFHSPLSTLINFRMQLMP